MTTADEPLGLPAGTRVREGWAMLNSHRPHAAWAIWQSVLLEYPGDAAAQAALDTLASAADLPEVARKPLRFLPPAGEAARKRWDKALRVALAGTETPTPAAPADAALAFRGLVDDDPDDAAALWNLAVCQAWMGSCRSAVESLDRFVDLAAATAPDRAADAWTLAELLRHGAGAENLADAVKLTARIPVTISQRFPASSIARAFGPVLSYAANGEPEPAVQAAFAADLLDRPLDNSGQVVSNVIASIVAEGPQGLFSAPATPTSGLFFRELADQWRFLNDGDRAVSVEISVLPIAMLDAAAFRFRLPSEISDEQRRVLTHKSIAAWFETEWIDQPRHGLGQMTPLQASAVDSPAMKARLEGIVQFQEQLARRPGRDTLYAGYDFDRLRYRLGLGTLPGKDDAKGEARHKALSLFDPAHVRSLEPKGLAPADLALAWETAFAVHDDAMAIRLGEFMADHSSDALANLSLADFVAPFLRRSLQSGASFDSGRDWLDFAIKTDTERHSRRDKLRLLKWKAEFASRGGEAASATLAWKTACEAPGAAPILAYEAVVDLWDLPGGPETARQFAVEALTWTKNEYAAALLELAAEHAADD